MPDVPPPEQCENEEDRFRRAIQDENNPPPLVKIYEEMLSVSLVIQTLAH